MTDPAVKASRVVADGKPTPTFDEGRVCSVPECITKLSVTNPGPACRVHSPRVRPRYRRIT
jgi:hypothetical protein